MKSKPLFSLQTDKPHENIFHYELIITQNVHKQELFYLVNSVKCILYCNPSVKISQHKQFG